MLLVVECLYLATFGNVGLPARFLAALCWILPALGLIGAFRLIVAARSGLQDQIEQPTQAQRQGLVLRP